MFHAPFFTFSSLSQNKTHPYKDILTKVIKDGNLNAINQIFTLKPLSRDALYFDYALLDVAIKAKQLDIVKVFIEQNFRVNRPDCSCEQKLLYHAVEWGNLEIISLLLAKGALIFGSDFCDKTSFHLAIRKKRQDIVASFLSQLDVGDLNEHGLLHFAVEMNDCKTLTSLWIKGLSITQKKKGTNMTPFCTAVKNKKWDALSLLFSFTNVSRVNLQVYNDIAPFYVACISGNTDIIQNYLKNGFDTNTRLKSRSSDWEILKNCDNFTGLHFAVKEKNLQSIQFLLAQSVDLRVKNAEGLPPLHLAIESINSGLQESLLITEVDEKMIKLLVEHGALNFLDADGNTALHKAFLLKKYEILHLLLSDKERVLVNVVNKFGLSHFHIACTRGDKSLVQSFLDRGVNINTGVHVKLTENKYWHGFSALHFATFFNRSEIVQLLLVNKADFHKMDCRGSTPLHIACQYNSEKFFFLIERFFTCMFDVKKNDLCALETELLLSREEQLEIIDQLSKKTCGFGKLDFYGHSPAYYIYDLNLDVIMNQVYQRIICSEALKTQFQKILQEELYTRRRVFRKKFPIGMNNCHSRNMILHYFAQKSQYEDEEKHLLLEYFLNKGASPNALNREKKTLLQEATRMGCIECIKILLKYNSNVNYAEPSNLMTSLHIACKADSRKNSSRIIELLLRKGANVHARDITGKAPLHYIAAKVKPQSTLIIVNLLKSSADVNCQDFDKKMTPLHVATKLRNPQAIEEFLKSGADVNIEDAKGKTVLCYVNDDIMKKCHSLRDMEESSSLTVKTLLYHALNLQVIGLHMSEKLQKSSAKLKRMYTSFHDQSMDMYLGWTMDGINQYTEIVMSNEVDSFIKECGLEKERLTEMLISKNTSLLHVIFMKKQRSIKKLIRNDIFLEILNLRVWMNTQLSFKHYGYLLELKYNDAITRKLLIAFAGESLRFIASPALPDLCQEYIFQYFSNKELKKFIDAAASSSLEGQTLYSRYCLEMRQIDHSFSLKLNRLKLTKELVD